MLTINEELVTWTIEPCRGARQHTATTRSLLPLLRRPGNNLAKQTLHYGSRDLVDLLAQPTDDVSPNMLKTCCAVSIKLKGK